MPASAQGTQHLVVVAAGILRLKMPGPRVFSFHHLAGCLLQILVSRLLLCSTRENYIAAAAAAAAFHSPVIERPWSLFCKRSQE